MTLQPRPLALLGALVLVLSFLFASAARADELDEVTRLHRTGQSAAALERADAFLATHPRDAQMRFLKAVVLAESGRATDAIGVLEKLVEDYPDLAEPYNNLAVLYAASGDYAKARSALDHAIRLKPTYATAHENLGDVYAALAARSYASALRLERDRPGVEAKLEAVRRALIPAGAASSAAAPASAPH
jgi:tetratricopeptide (TPR) repeat protein